MAKHRVKGVPEGTPFLFLQHFWHKLKEYRLSQLQNYMGGYKCLRTGKDTAKFEILNSIKTQNPNDQNVDVLNSEHLELGYSGDIIPDL